MEAEYGARWIAGRCARTEEVVTMVPPPDVLVGERMGGRKTERRLKCEVRFAVSVEVNWRLLREVRGAGVMGAAMQFIRMVGSVLNYAYLSVAGI